MDSITSTNTAQNPRRALARAVLSLLVGMLTIFVVISGVPLMPVVVGQTPSPSPTESPDASPSPSPAGPEVHFVNPSRYGGADVLSARDMEEHGYHISAWVSEVPPNASMLFELERDGAERPVGNGTFVPPDTFEIHWMPPEPAEVPEGEHTLRAILFSGGNEVSRAERTVSVERNTATARLDYPTSNGTPMGLHIAPGENQQWLVTLDFTYSSGTSAVRFFYSRAPAGTELQGNWTGCGLQRVSSALGGASAPASGRHLCTLAAGHDGRDVTAVAVVANETRDPTGELPLLIDLDGGGDAHRILAYRQVPSRVGLGIEDTRHQYTPGECTNQIEAFVFDQEDRIVPRANVDVHATGPEEGPGRIGLRFDTSTGTDTNQAPDSNHSADDEQAGWSCSGNNPAGSQGNHRNPAGADTRHIESVLTGAAARTDLNGRFRFRLRSDELGGTQVTAWADIDNDDVFCADEPSASTSVGWGEPAPTVVPHQPETNQCTVPEPTTTPTPRPSPSPSPSPEEINVQRRIGLQRLRPAGPNRVQARGRVRASGRPRCARRVPVRIQRRVGNRWNNIRRPQTNARRFYRARFPDRPGRYRALAPRVVRESPDGRQLICGRAVSRVRRR